MRIGIDVGHYSNCFKETGAKGLKLYNGDIVEEYALNRLIAIDLHKMLKSHPDIDVFYIQGPNANKEKPLKARSAMANKLNLDLLFSIHHDWSGNKNLYGFGLYKWYTNKKMTNLANSICKNLEKAGFKKRLGVQSCRPGEWTNFHMVRETNCDTILAECGYFSSPGDRARTRNSLFREKFCKSITEAIIKHYKLKPLDTKINVDIEEILQKYTDDGKEWMEFIEACGKIAAQNSNLGILEKGVYLPTLLKKVYLRKRKL